MKILIINGVNMCALGTREPHIYGTKTLAQINEGIKDFAQERGVEVEFFCSNHEGEIVDKILSADCPIIINPASHSHYSLAIADALRAVDQRKVEVHLTNVFGRERTTLVTAPCVDAVFVGAGEAGYRLAIIFLTE